jgi:hypothetical protein
MATLNSIMQRVGLLALTVTVGAGAAIGSVNARETEYEERGREGGTYAIGLWGDMPYVDKNSEVQALTGVPNLIADMNAQNLAFTIHNGDLKAGNGFPTVGGVAPQTPNTCSNEFYAQSKRYFDMLKAPAMFTPGDNDWTDCDRPSNGGFNSLERLNYERNLLFSGPVYSKYSLGQRRLKQEVQAAPYVENRRWTVKGVTYVTLNVQGSCNNLCDTAPDPAEFKARNAANIAWLKASFTMAKTRNSAAVMIISQADPGWDLSDGTRTPLRDPKTLAERDFATVTNNDVTTAKPVAAGLDGFQEYLWALRAEVIAFKKPVAYVHGDSHYQRIDKPFLDSTGKRIENFTRVQTPGSNPANGNNDVQWVKVYVDSSSREVFSYQNQVVPKNRAVLTP